MKKLHWIAFAATAAVLAIGSSVGTRVEAKPSCVRAGGTATMITEDLAKYMATAALNNSISNMGAKAVGKVSMTCAMNMGMPSCTARQKACKS
jgi:hypothetical protein